MLVALTHSLGWPLSSGAGPGQHLASSAAQLFFATSPVPQARAVPQQGKGLGLLPRGTGDPQGAGGSRHPPEQTGVPGVISTVKEMPEVNKDLAYSRT